MSLLEVDGLIAFYGDFQALFGISLQVAEGEAVALIGSNGAGKSTLLRALTGLMPIGGGDARFDGVSLALLPAHRIVARGLALVPEGRRLFPSLSVEENLLMGAYAGRSGPWNLARVYALFPVLGERARLPSCSLSGGQQQMVAIGRALMSNPRLLLCDEISLGLAPIVIRDIYAALPAIRTEGTAVLVVEQDTGQALRVADRVYCFQEGRVSLEGRPEDLGRERIAQAYFGV
ncbi:high-affinity branched-chain amino acid transport ATP-binding protein LivF [mine drainage metagenome]|uniref:High-affinity branched-chain amino acid transport ATP-binding protein LivF n=1 Tax=mine drainage metagenome TaxID=410659 RepID=A0A1J5RL46_9ZZZZ